MKGKKGWGFALILAVCLAMAAPVMAADTLKIGVMYPMSGPLAYTGQQCLRGAEIARDLINEAGGVKGHKIKFVIGDSVSPKDAMAEAERLITVEKVPVISGGYSSSNSFAASDVCERHKTVFWITTGVGDPITSRGYKYIFQLNTRASQWGSTTADFLAKMAAPKLGIKVKDFRLALIHEDSLFGTIIGDNCVERAKELGLQVVERITYSHKTVDLSSEIAKLKAAKADGIVSIHYVNDGDLFYGQAKQMRLNTKVMVGSVFFGLNQFQKKFGTLVNNVCVVDPPTRVEASKLAKPAAEVLSEFRKRFKAKYKADPGDPGFTSFGGMYVLLKNVLPKAKGFDAKSIQEAALSLDLQKLNTPYVFGVRFQKPPAKTAGANLNAFPVIMQWQNQKLIVVYPEKLASSPVELPMPTWKQRTK
ncbi:MAG: ABC transporter substrate-binding protein [Deltaproteobacteria bacterium]|nr:ABC transporter substrate-binding protein [Deltaproteobacteria bacterium]